MCSSNAAAVDSVASFMVALRTVVVGLASALSTIVEEEPSLKRRLELGRKYPRYHGVLWSESLLGLGLSPQLIRETRYSTEAFSLPIEAQ